MDIILDFWTMVGWLWACVSGIHAKRFWDHTEFIDRCIWLALLLTCVWPASSRFYKLKLGILSFFIRSTSGLNKNDSQDSHIHASEMNAGISLAMILYSDAFLPAPHQNTLNKYWFFSVGILNRSRSNGQLLKQDKKRMDHTQGLPSGQHVLELLFFFWERSQNLETCYPPGRLSLWSFSCTSRMAEH